jgi:hypothetical protein
MCLLQWAALHYDREQFVTQKTGYNFPEQNSLHFPGHWAANQRRPITKEGYRNGQTLTNQRRGV